MKKKERKEMKKKVLAMLGMAMIVGCMSACGTTEAAANDAVEEAVVDEAAEVEETVEDAAEEVVEEATEEVADEAEEVVEGTSEDVVYVADDYSVTYNTASFEASEERGYFNLTYVNADVDVVAPSSIIINVEEGTTVDEMVATILEGRELSEDSVSDVVIGSQELAGKSINESLEAETEDELPLYDTVILVQSGDNVICIELARIISDNDEAEMTIDGAFTGVLESFVLNQ